MPKVFEEVPAVSVVDGLIVIDGSAFLAATFTAEAALELSERLGTAAVMALVQRVAEPPLKKK